MSLRHQLNDLLPQILPSSPKDAIKGTELIRLVKLQLSDGYSDASLRYHFSIMSCDPSSVIAKVEKGQGYYRRTAQVPALAGAKEILSMTQGRLDGFGQNSEEIDSALDRLQKFRAIITIYTQSNGSFPFTFRKSLSRESPLSNLWKYPDMVSVDWEAGEPGEKGLLLDPKILQVKQSLGIPAYRLKGLRLRLSASLELFREDFFQTLSLSEWLQGAQLCFAETIQDEALADSLRKLGQTYGIGVTSFGLSPDVLDELPSPANILNARPREMEAILSKLDVRTITSSQMREHLNWSALQNLVTESVEVVELLSWLQNCLEEGEASAFLEN